MTVRAEEDDYPYHFYKDDLNDMFDYNSNLCTGQLAILSAELSQRAEDHYSDNILNCFEHYDISNPVVKNYKDNENDDEYNDYMAHAVGYKKLDDGTDVIIVVARGTTSFREVIDDMFNAGTVDFNGERVNMFVESFCTNIFASIGECIRTADDLNGQHVKFLVTGHSLGGAAANLVAARLNDMAKTANYMDKDSIYCYTFGALSPIYSGKQVSDGYENIHNFYNIKDTYSPNSNWSAFLNMTNLGNGSGKFGHRELFIYDIYYDKGEMDDPVNAQNHSMNIYIDYIENKPNMIEYSCSVGIKSIYAEKGDNSYSVGDILDTSDIKVYAVYEDGEERCVTDKADIDTSDVDMDTVGEYEIKITYEGFVTYLAVYVEEKLNIFALPKKIVYDGSPAHNWEHGYIKLEKISSPIKSAKSSDKSVISKCYVDNKENVSFISYSINSPGTTILTVKDEAGHSGKCTIVVKDNFFASMLVPACTWNYGEKVVKVTTMPKAKVELSIGGDKYKARANVKGEASIKVSKVYKYKSVYKLTSTYKKMRKTTYSSISTNAFSRVNGSVYTNSNAITFRLVGIHKGDVLTVQTDTQTKNYTFTKSTYPEYFDFTIHMNSNLSCWATYIKHTIKNKYGQKLYTKKDNISWNY